MGGSLILKPTEQSNPPNLFGEGFSLTSTLEGGYVFLHIELEQFNKATLISLQSSLQTFKKDCAQLGHSVVFATTPNKRTVKFWQLVEPCYQVEALKDKGWLGAWLTEEI